MKKICQYCQIEFVASGEYSKRHRRYCSLECYKKSINTTINIECQTCGKKQRNKFMTYFTPMNLEWREKDAN